mgnify:FL=1|tara:strand:+ start:575 stop:802 length:228 start_codon:yes stop_codon:yes gene_type:complete
MKTKITIELEASEINKNYMLVECPLCKKSIHSKFYKYHQHGSSGNTDNRIEHRKGHCLYHNSYFIIHINDNTLRT